MAGTSDPTIADLALAATFSSIQSTDLVPTSQYAELSAWLEKVKAAVPNYEKANGEGVAMFGEFFKKKLAELKGK